jgi:hypothetical protein
VFTMRSRRFTLQYTHCFALALVLLTTGAAAARNALPKSYMLDRLPADALEVGEAMQKAGVGEEIVLRGRITDGNDVFIANRAIFRLADESAVPSCCAPGQNARESGGACGVPTEMRATVQFLDSRRHLINTGLKGKHGLAVGKEVFVVGTVHQTDNEKVLIVNASKIHVPEGNVPFGLMLETEPENARDVSQAKEEARPGDTITIRGRVGGSSRPFIDGRAVFTLVGSEPKACSDIPGDNCRTPWDYCCVPRREILAHSATIQLVDAKNAVLRTDIKGRRGIRELSDVTVVGTVGSTDRGALIVNATGIYVHGLHDDGSGEPDNRSPNPTPQTPPKPSE